jgi:hypothetical protein
MEGTAVSVKVSNWAWHEARDRDGKKLTGNLFILLLALADVADDSGSCLRFAPGQEGLTYDALATKTGVDRRTIIRLVAKLRDEGLVDHRPGVKGRANEFLVMAPWTSKSGDKLSPNGESDAVTTGADSVTDSTEFGDNSSSHSSYRRIDVADVTTSGVSTLWQRFAQPLCGVLVAELIRNEVKHPDPMSKRWLDAARLLVDVDKRDPHQAKQLIEWACRDGFWRANILSMPTFREQYDKLRLARERAVGKTSTVEHGRSVDQILRDREALEQRAVSA